ncbi:helix-turn-helix transcriptional regulator [Stackebrandtia nassauensis]|uniref:Helix-turn-helix type 11 domain protein n=1 Tax=Stackebrandtia nassauensis (strain DSM 44728 / CIP 108903 / NRRL B-16338 / NBRC 102104 / LLR-40K-21) TaxID=446470 RepID=D3QAB7_STANL|nr:WYL domain-containing protein [Stackebrandtia nassauensis]ADD42700.1 Helix-turn-helix type 11 domain protein [Stackebrandtia nassauensis DSM 44728]
MRAARLISMVLLLQNRGSLTADQLSAELGVSPRTIARDATELAEAGIPVYAEQGRGGGYRLLDGFRTRLTGLGRAEVEALFLSGAPEALSGMGLDSAALAARLKIGAALAPSVREAPRRVGQRFHLDAPGWFRKLETPDALAELSSAVWSDRLVEVRYRRGRRLGETAEPEPVTRTLAPFGLVLKAGVWYLVAGVGDDVRIYRVDRFDDVAVADTEFTRDEDFDLAAFWRRQQEEFAASMMREHIVVRLSPDGRQRLHRAVDAATVAGAEFDEPDADGWTRARLPVETLDVAYEEMLSLGPDVEVVEPKPLRARLAEAARRLGELYD